MRGKTRKSRGILRGKHFFNGILEGLQQLIFKEFHWGLRHFQWILDVFNGFLKGKNEITENTFPRQGGGGGILNAIAPYICCVQYNLGLLQSNVLCRLNYVLQTNNSKLNMVSEVIVI